MCQKLESHLIREHEIGEFRHKCDQCGKAYSEKQKLKKHKETVHEGKSEKNFVCDICGKIVTTSGALVIHKESMINQLM